MRLIEEDFLRDVGHGRQLTPCRQAQSPKRPKPPVNLKPHAFRDKLVLNQWLISLFGLDPAQEYIVGNRRVRAFHRLADRLR